MVNESESNIYDRRKKGGKKVRDNWTNWNEDDWYGWFFNERV